jgi:TolB-like protein
MKKIFFCLIPVVMVLTGCAGIAEPAENPAKPVVQAVEIPAATPAANPVDTSGGMTLDQAIKEAAIRIDERITAGSRIAPLNFNSPADKFSGYVLDELTACLVDSGKLTVVDRKEVDLIRREFNFQFSGEVGDDSMQELGRMLGAQSIVSGSLTDLGGLYRIVIRVLNVQNASVEVQYRTNIAGDNIVAALLTGGKAAVTTAAAQGSSPTRTPAATTAQAAPAGPVVLAVQASAEPTGSAYKVGATGPAGGTVFHPVVRTASVPKPTDQVYKVGDTGPAGGIIFHVNLAAGEWKYLEAAPATAEATSQWSISQKIATKSIKDSRGVGMGKPNTEYIMQQAMQLGGGFGWAAQICDELEVNGYDDWFLPSRDELNIMWGALHRRGLGGFKSEWYWSSTPSNDDGTCIWIINFAHGSQLENLGGFYSENWNKQYRVRAIRQF